MTERVSRPVRFAQVTALKAQGLTNNQIAAELGLTRSGVLAVINDPDGSKQRARREGYKGTCARCGGETRSDGTSRASEICLSCTNELARIWTREAVIEVIQRWAREHGRPPRVADWRRKDEAHGYPQFSSIYGEAHNFPTWADAIEAAGFPRPKTGVYVPKERLITCADCSLTFTVATHGASPLRCSDCTRRHRNELNVPCARAYYQRNKETILARARGRYAKDPARYAAYQREYRARRKAREA